MEPVKLPDKENAWKDMLNSKYWFGIVGHCNLWHSARVALPSTAWGSATVNVSNTGVIFDFTKLKVPQTRTNAGAANPYTLGNDSSQATAYTDYYDLKEVVAGKYTGGKDTVGADLFPTYDSVIYSGPRVYYTTTLSSGFSANSGFTGTYEQFYDTTTSLFVRPITVNSNGVIVKIGAEVLVNMPSGALQGS